MCLTTIITVNFIHSRGGRAVMAVRDDELALAMGINTTRWKLAAFVFGAATAAIGGRCTRPAFRRLRRVIFIMAHCDSDYRGTRWVGSITGLCSRNRIRSARHDLQNFGTIRMIIYSLALILIMLLSQRTVGRGSSHSPLSTAIN